MTTTINDYYRWATDQVKEAVSAASDADVIARDADSWVEHLVSEYALEPIEEDSSRATEGEECEVSNSRPGHFDITTGGFMGPTRSAIRYFLPVVPSVTLDTIWKHRLSPNTFSISHGYPIADYIAARAALSFVVQPIKEAFDHEMNRIRQEIRNYNQSISDANAGFRNPILGFINTRARATPL